jgi:hypothetical protein
MSFHPFQSWVRLDTMPLYITRPGYDRISQSSQPVADTQVVCRKLPARVSDEHEKLNSLDEYRCLRNLSGRL